MSIPSRRTSIWPAASVLIIAIGTLGIFMVINAVTSTTTVTTTTVAVVGGLTPATDAALTNGCSSSGQPPIDIQHALSVPTGTTLIGHKIVNQGAGEFDCYLDYASTANSADILAFYRARIPALGWKLFSSGHAAGGSHGQQLLFQIAGSDSFYWVYGITINATAPEVRFRIQVYQNNSLI
jgi:hypothetical protein